MGAESNLAAIRHSVPAEADPVHLHPTAPLAQRVLLPGDPGRALLLAQALLEPPAMFNHHRGLWGYTGTASDGQLLTVQSTGMGGPSAAIVATELAKLGARQLVRVGTCGALDDTLALGDLVIVTEAISDDGASRALASAASLTPDPVLLDALERASCGRAALGRVASTDLFYDAPAASERWWAESGAVAVELETAALFAVADRRALQAASLLLVSDLVPSGTRISPEGLRAGEGRLGEVAMTALAYARA